MCDEEQVARINASSVPVLLLGGLLIFGFCFLVGGCTEKQRQWEHKRQLKQSYEIRDFGLRKFAALDYNGDGIVSEGELGMALQDADVPPSDLPLIEVMRESVGKIGHHEGQRRDGKFTYSYSGIGKSDLKSYPGRVNRVSCN